MWWIQLESHKHTTITNSWPAWLNSVTQRWEVTRSVDSKILRLHARVRRSLIINVLRGLDSPISQSCVLFWPRWVPGQTITGRSTLVGCKHKCCSVFLHKTTSPDIVLRAGSGVSEESRATPAGCRSARTCCRQIRLLALCSFFYFRLHLPLLIKFAQLCRGDQWSRQATPFVFQRAVTVNALILVLKL